MMNLQDAITTSDYSTALNEYGDLYTIVEATDSDFWQITTGKQGLPPHGYQQVHSLEESLEAIKAMDLDNNEWEPVGEEE